MGLGGDDVVVTLPRPVGELTYDEWHALLLSIVPGWLVGFGILIGQQEAVFGLGLALLASAGVVKAKALPMVGSAVEQAEQSAKAKCPSTAGKASGVIRREPWYFLTVLAVVATATYGVGTWPWL